MDRDEYKAKVDGLTDLTPSGAVRLRPGTVFAGTLPQCEGWTASPYEDKRGPAILYTSPHHNPMILRNGKLSDFE